ncbi:hypothetical protein RSAG8_13751, partial [Rhizoctonia solani AG-8 WAC10335]
MFRALCTNDEAHPMHVQALEDEWLHHATGMPHLGTKSQTQSLEAHSEPSGQFYC